MHTHHLTMTKFTHPLIHLGDFLS